MAKSGLADEGGSVDDGCLLMREGSGILDDDRVRGSQSLDGQTHECQVPVFKPFGQMVGDRDHQKPFDHPSLSSPTVVVVLEEKHVLCFQLDKIKSGHGLVKERDETLLANTFDPDDVKSAKSNKRREQEQLEQMQGKRFVVLLNRTVQIFRDTDGAGGTGFR